MALMVVTGISLLLSKTLPEETSAFNGVYVKKLFLNYLKNFFNKCKPKQR